MSKTKAIAKVETPVTTALTLPEGAPEMWGDEGVEGRDILIGKALLMQGQSDFVQDGKAGVGEIRNSLTEELLGTAKKPFRFVPFFSQKVWVILKKPKGSDDKVRWEYVESYPCTKANENQEWEGEEGDFMIRRDLCINYYVLNADKIEDLPLLVSFRRTSFRAGKKMASFVTQLKSIKKPMATRVFELGSEQSEKDGSKFSIYTVNMTQENVAQETFSKAFEWYNTVKLGLESGTIKEDNTDLEKEAAGAKAKGQAGDETPDNVEY